MDRVSEEETRPEVYICRTLCGGPQIGEESGNNHLGNHAIIDRLARHPSALQLQRQKVHSLQYVPPFIIEYRQSYSASPLQSFHPPS